MSILNPFIVFVSGHFPLNTYYAKLTRRTIERYTKLHGYGFFYDETQPESTNTHELHYKRCQSLQYAFKMYPNSRWFVWVDSDVYVNDYTTKVENVIDLTDDNILYHLFHEKPWSFPVNTGVKFVNRDAMELEQEIFSLRNSLPWCEFPFEQKAIAEYIMPKYGDKIKIHDPYKLNCLEKAYGQEVSKNAVFIHLCAMNEIQRNNITRDRLDNASFAVFYGKGLNFIDVTEIVYEKCIMNDTLVIPSGDMNRYNIFNADPTIGIVKEIRVVLNGEIFHFEHDKNIEINLNNSIPFTRRLFQLQSKIKLDFGSFLDEYVEQTFAVKYICPSSSVLELGGNIGRNSMIIASILNDDKKLVTLETDPNSVEKLIINRDKNGFLFFIEPHALSKRKLIQKGWDTIPSDVVLDGYYSVSSISFDELEKKYEIKFDTLVVDCEGALYYILQDNPELLSNIKTVIMENDYHNIEHKKYVDKILQKYGLSIAFQQCGGWGPCADFFYEVWKRL